MEYDVGLDLLGITEMSEFLAYTIIGLSLGGLALSATSLVIAWRFLRGKGGKLRSVSEPSSTAAA